MALATLAPRRSARHHGIRAQREPQSIAWRQHRCEGLGIKIEQSPDIDRRPLDSVMNRPGASSRHRKSRRRSGPSANNDQTRRCAAAGRAPAASGTSSRASDATDASRRSLARESHNSLMTRSPQHRLLPQVELPAATGPRLVASHLYAAQPRVIPVRIGRVEHDDRLARRIGECGAQGPAVRLFQLGFRSLRVTGEQRRRRVRGLRDVREPTAGRAGRTCGPDRARNRAAPSLRRAPPAASERPRRVARARRDARRRCDNRGARGWC